jgi:hypothetical protein
MQRKFGIALGAVITAGAMAAATSGHASTTTFADISSISSSPNIEWLQSTNTVPVYTTEPVYTIEPVYKTEPVYTSEPVYATVPVYKTEIIGGKPVQVQVGTKQVQTGTKLVQTGTKQVQTGTQKVQTGTQQVQTGTKQVPGSGGQLFTLGSNGKEGSTKVKFTFLPLYTAQLGTVSALFTMNGTVASGNPVNASGNFLDQPGLTGTFSLIYTGSAPLQLGELTYYKGADLLSGSIFADGDISGRNNGASGSVVDSTSSGGVIVFKSDVFRFTESTERDFSLSLTSITAPLGYGSGTSLDTFKGVVGGSFSSNAVPEPSTWAMMILGAGLVGLALRRRTVALAA